MSSIYNTEPQPTASVILHTNHGDLSVELFAKQTPLSSRNFLQHCLDGYYDNTIFHRLVPGFILQGGDPTGTGNGGESIYDRGAFSGDLDPWPMDQRRGKNAGPIGVNFKDEFHSRLKFNRRGLLGMANEGTVDSNGSQFFFTLDKTAELDGKNTLFGRIAGDTIYNLAKMGEGELHEGSERPVYPTKITSVEILVNPFADMKKRERVAQRTAAPAVAAKKKDKKRKGGKQLLSFGEEEGDGDIEPLPKKPKFDTRIVLMDVDEEETEPSSKPRKSKASKKGKDTSESVDLKTSVPIREASARQSPLREPSPPPKASSKQTREKVKVKEEVESSPEPEPAKHKSELERTNEEIAAIKASLKKTIQSSEPMQNEKKKSALEQMIPETSTRGRKRRPGGNNPTATEERKALDFIKSFKSKLERAPAEKSTETLPPAAEASGASQQEGGAAAVGDGGDDDDEVCDLHFIANCQSCKAWDNVETKDDSDDEGWMSHSLSFAADKLGKDLSYRKKAEEELIVIDPLEKARSLGAQRKEKGRGGTSGRAWDALAKNAQLARASSLAGRGAK